MLRIQKTCLRYSTHPDTWMHLLWKLNLLYIIVKTIYMDLCFDSGPTFWEGELQCLFSPQWDRYLTLHFKLKMQFRRKIRIYVSELDIKENTMCNCVKCFTSLCNWLWNATRESFVLLSIVFLCGNLHHCSCLARVTTCNSDIAELCHPFFSSLEKSLNNVIKIFHYPFFISKKILLKMFN